MAKQNQLTTTEDVTIAQVNPVLPLEHITAYTERITQSRKAAFISIQVIDLVSAPQSYTDHHITIRAKQNCYVPSTASLLKYSLTHERVQGISCASLQSIIG